MLIHVRLRYYLGHAIVMALHRLNSMLNCTYRGNSYQVPARYRVEHELSYARQSYVDRIINDDKIMSYRGIRHSLVTN